MTTYSGGWTMLYATRGQIYVCMTLCLCLFLCLRMEIDHFLLRVNFLSLLRHFLSTDDATGNSNFQRGTGASASITALDPGFSPKLFAYDVFKVRSSLVWCCVTWCHRLSGGIGFIPVLLSILFAFRALCVVDAVLCFIGILLQDCITRFAVVHCVASILSEHLIIECCIVAVHTDVRTYGRIGVHMIARQPARTWPTVLQGLDTGSSRYSQIMLSGWTSFGNTLTAV